MITYLAGDASTLTGKLSVNPSSTTDITGVLMAWRDGRTGALDELMPLVYGELRSLARGHVGRERPGHTLGPTGVLHEAYLRLADKTHPRWQGRVHFFAVVAQVIRRVLIDHARGRRAAKRGGGEIPTAIEESKVNGAHPAPEVADVLALDQALRRLARFDARKCRVIELHYFGGLTHAEVAAVLGVSPATVRLDARLGRAWLARELKKGLSR